MSLALEQILVSELSFDSKKISEIKASASAAKVSIFRALEEDESIDFKPVLEAYGQKLGCKTTVLSDKDIPRNIINLIPADTAKQLKVIPIDRAANNIVLAMSNPKDLKALDAIRFKTGYTVQPVLAGEVDIDDALNRYYNNQMAMKVGKLEQEAFKKGENTNFGKAQREIITSNGKDENAVKKMANDILMACVTMGASDIHIEPYEETLRVRLRIDGALVNVANPPKVVQRGLTARFKIMSNLDITEERKPQDGGIRVHIEGKDIDFRVSTIPTVHGEKIVMRILDKSALEVDMTKLGFEEDDLKKFKDSIHNPFGMVLVTGPTGSGKTTTLYSALAELNKETENIMTAEDPVEFNLEGINQSQMKPDVGHNFATALKAFLRQDPDIIMVGEIRDLETGGIAIKAALTGHMVLSTLHTNSASDTIVRLINMGVEPFNLIAALVCVVAQRLARKICSSCRVIDEDVTPEALLELGIPKQYINQVKAYKGKGCDECNKSGMKGRVAIHEVMVLNDAIKETILKGGSAIDIKRAAIKSGMRTLRQAALNKMARGLIPASEVIKNSASDSKSDSDSQMAS